MQGLLQRSRLVILLRILSKGLVETKAQSLLPRLRRSTQKRSHHRVTSSLLSRTSTRLGPVLGPLTLSPTFNKTPVLVGLVPVSFSLVEAAPTEQGGAADQEQGGATPPEKGGATPGKGTPPTTEQATPPPPQHVFRDNWSQLSRDKLVDKVKGVIYGQAIGDALGSTRLTYFVVYWLLSITGLATEFMNKTEAAHYYGKEGPSHYSQIIHDFHRSRFPSSVPLGVYT